MKSSVPIKVAFAIPGFQALKLLMKGAKQVPTKSPFYQKYIKKGTKEVAKEDFKAANPNRLTHRETKLGVI